MDPISAIQTIATVAKLVHAQLQIMAANSQEAADLASRVMALIGIVQKVADNKRFLQTNGGALERLVADLKEAETICTEINQGADKSDGKLGVFKAKAKRFLLAQGEKVKLEEFNRKINNHVAVLTPGITVAAAEDTTEKLDHIEDSMKKQQEAMDAMMQQQMAMMGQMMSSFTAAAVTKQPNMAQPSSHRHHRSSSRHGSSSKRSRSSGRHRDEDSGTTGASKEGEERSTDRARREKSGDVETGDATPSSPTAGSPRGGDSNDDEEEEEEAEGLTFARGVKAARLPSRLPPFGKIVEIAAHQLVFGTFVAGVALTAPTAGFRAGVLLLVPIIPVLVVMAAWLRVCLVSRQLAVKLKAAAAGGGASASLDFLASLTMKATDGLRQAFAVYQLYFAPSGGALVAMSLYSFFSDISSDSELPMTEFYRGLLGVLGGTLLYTFSFVATNSG